MSLTEKVQDNFIQLQSVRNWQHTDWCLLRPRDRSLPLSAVSTSHRTTSPKLRISTNPADRVFFRHIQSMPIPWGSYCSQKFPIKNSFLKSRLMGVFRLFNLEITKTLYTHYAQYYTHYTISTPFFPIFLSPWTFFMSCDLDVHFPPALKFVTLYSPWSCCQ